MKKYLLLASVAGCLMASNAMAISDPITVNSTDDLSAVVNISAKLAKAMIWRYNDVNFGNIVLSGTVANNDVIATFTGGELEFATGKTVTHGGEEAGWIQLSSVGEAAMAAGISFEPTTVDLYTTSGGNPIKVAEMTDIGTAITTNPNGEYVGDSGVGYFINGSLKITDVSAVPAGGESVTGTTTVTLTY